MRLGAYNTSESLKSSHSKWPEVIFFKSSQIAWYFYLLIVLIQKNSSTWGDISLKKWEHTAGFCWCFVYSAFLELCLPPTSHQGLPPIVGAPSSVKGGGAPALSNKKLERQLWSVLHVSYWLPGSHKRPLEVFDIDILYSCQIRVQVIPTLAICRLWSDSVLWAMFHLLPCNGATVL